MQHKTRFCDILWRCIFSWKAIHQIQARYKASQTWHPLRWNRSYSHSWEQWITCKPSYPISVTTQSHYELSWKKDTALLGVKNSNTSFQKIKSLLEKALLKPLRYYDRNKPVTPSVRHISQRTGACIMQEGQPIAFHEQITHRYRDSLCKHWERTPSHHIWLWEVPHILVRKDICCWDWSQTPRNDQHEESHHSSSQVAENVTPTAAVRYDHNVQTRQGNAILADTLSRLPSRSDTEIKLNLRVNAITMSAFTRSHLMKIATETQRDPILSTVHRLTSKLLATETCTNVPRIARNYWDFRDELSINDDLTHERQKSCHSDIMQRLHHGRSHIIAMKVLTKQCPWPGHACIGQVWKQT